MYAIIRAGGQQHQVEPASVISLNRLPLEQGAAFETDQVLLLEQEGAELRIGTPLVSGALVRGRVLGHERGPKVLVYKQKRRKNYRRKRGHRQELTRVLIEGIELDGQLIATAPARTPQPAAVEASEEAPAKPAAKAKSAAGKTPRTRAPAAESGGKGAAKPKKD